MSTMGFTKAMASQQVEETILIPETYTHAVCIGQTGSGKTTSFIYPNIQHRIEQGHGLLVYDYKGTICCPCPESCKKKEMTFKGYMKKKEKLLNTYAQQKFME